MRVTRVRDRLDRALTRERDTLSLVVPLALLVVSLGISLVTEPLFEHSVAETAMLVGLSAFTACWIAWFATGPRRTAERATTYLVGRVLFAAVLSWINPFMAVFAFCGYLDAYGRLSRPWVGFVFVMTALTMAGSQSGGLPPGSIGQWALFGILALVNLGLAGAVVYLGARDDAISRERVRTITALEQANARLQEALAENARLHEDLVAQARDAGIVEERERLAREIHDTIAQGLAGIVTQLEAVGDDPATTAARRHLDRAAALARESLDEARRSVRDLGPRALDDGTLSDALEELTTRWSRSNPAETTYTVTGCRDRLHPEVESTLLRIAQESLTNVAKHAGARRVGVTLTYMDDEVALDVRDDGAGFDGTDPAGGYGLAGMRQRVARLAGTLTLETAPGTGTAVCVRIPSVRHG